MTWAVDIHKFYKVSIVFIFMVLMLGLEETLKYIQNMVDFFWQKILDKMAEDHRQKKEA